MMRYSNKIYALSTALGNLVLGLLVASASPAHSETPSWQAQTRNVEVALADTSNWNDGQFRSDDPYVAAVLTHYAAQYRRSCGVEASNEVLSRFIRSTPEFGLLYAMRQRLDERQEESVTQPEYLAVLESVRCHFEDESAVTTLRAATRDELSLKLKFINKFLPFWTPIGSPYVDSSAGTSVVLQTMMAKSPRILRKHKRDKRKPKSPPIAAMENLAKSWEPASTTNKRFAFP